MFHQNSTARSIKMILQTLKSQEALVMMVP